MYNPFPILLAKIVFGCLEGVFAQGQVYVLISRRVQTNNNNNLAGIPKLSFVPLLGSRVTDPRNLCLIGVPPIDLINDVAMALHAAGLNVDDFFIQACNTTGDHY